MFRFNYRVPYNLVSGVVYEYTQSKCNSSYYSGIQRHLKFRSCEHIRISLFTFRETKPSKESSIRDHLLQPDNNLLFNEFTILGHGNKNNILEIKENLLIKRYQPLLSKSISSPMLDLFDKA